MCQRVQGQTLQDFARSASHKAAVGAHGFFNRCPIMRSRVPINIAVAHRRANKSNNNNEAFSGFLKVGGTLIFLKSFRGKDPLVAMGLSACCSAPLMWIDLCVTARAFYLITPVPLAGLPSRKPADVSEEPEHCGEYQNDVKQRRDFKRYPHCFPRFQLQSWIRNAAMKIASAALIRVQPKERSKH
jgi:hypothetical protein